MAEQHVHLPVQDAIPNQEQERSADIPVREAVLAASCSTKSHKKIKKNLWDQSLV